MITESLRICTKKFLIRLLYKRYQRELLFTFIEKTSGNHFSFLLLHELLLSMVVAAAAFNSKFCLPLRYDLMKEKQNCSFQNWLYNKFRQQTLVICTPRLF